MPLLTREQLLTSARKGLTVTESRSLKNYSFQADYHVFLSHSHKDKVAAKGLIYMLAREGLSVYVDWEDGELPRNPGRETAEKIKRMIKAAKYFLLLGTENAFNSKWVPWELGVADEAKTSGKILVAITQDGADRGSEYLELYRRVELSSLGQALRVVGPGATTGSSVKSYFPSPQIILG